MKNIGSVEVDGFNLRYQTEGAGPDALVIGSSIYYPRSFSQNLRKTLRLHFIDYRGFAEGPEMELPFESLIDDIECIRQKLCLKKCIVIGHSAHGLLALEYAKKYPEYVSHIVIIGMPPHMRQENITMAQLNWEKFAEPERKAAFERNLKVMPDEKLNQLPREQWFLQMNFRNVPKSWYDYNFDSTLLWKGVRPNINILDQMYLKFVREIDVSQGLESLDLPVFLVYGRFEFLVAPVHSWAILRHKFKNLSIQVFEKSAHSPHYEESALFDKELLRWIKETSN